MIHQKTIIIDLDNTLIDSNCVNSQINFCVEKVLGGKENAWREYCGYNKNKRINGFPKSLYDFCLEKGGKESYEQVFEELDFSKCLFTKVTETLEWLKTKGNLILLTKGPVRFQTLKARQNNLDNYFYEIFIVRDKLKFVEKNIFTGNIFYINDKPTEIEQFKEVYPKSTTVWVKQGYYADKNYKFKIKPDMQLDNFNELLSLD